jgi:hypothetical protein
MKTRTPKEIDREIKKLRAIKPGGIFKVRTQETLDLVIEELESGVDDTAGEWYELSDGQRDAVTAARLWKDGLRRCPPSKDFLEDK